MVCLLRAGFLASAHRLAKTFPMLMMWRMRRWRSEPRKISPSIGSWLRSFLRARIVLACVIINDETRFDSIVNCPLSQTTRDLVELHRMCYVRNSQCSRFDSHSFIFGFRSVRTCERSQTRYAMLTILICTKDSAGPRTHVRIHRSDQRDIEPILVRR